MKKFLISILSISILGGCLIGCSEKPNIEKSNSNTINKQVEYASMNDLSELMLNEEGANLFDSYYVDIEEQNYALRKIGKMEDFSFIFKEKYPELKNKEHLVVFSKTTCEACNDLIPKLIDTTEDTPIIYVYLRNSKDDIKENLKKLNLEMPKYLYTTDDFLDDVNTEIAVEKFNLYAVPTTLTVNSSGVISYVHIGGFESSDIEKIKRIGFEGTGVTVNKFLYEYTID